MKATVARCACASRAACKAWAFAIGPSVWQPSSASAAGCATCRDGSVEALFCGPAQDVAEMLERCRGGPRSAHVTAVEIVEEGGAAPEGFEVLPTVLAE